MLTKFPQAVEYMHSALAILGGAFVAVATGSGPMGLMVIGIGGLISAAVEMRKEWKIFQDFWDQLWDGMFDQVASVVNPIIALLNKIPGVNVDQMSTGVFQKARYSQRFTEDFAKQAETQKDFLKPSDTPDFLKHSAVMAHRFPAYAGGGTTNNTQVAAIHVHVKGGDRWTPEDARKHAREIKHELSRANDANRTKKRNSDSATGM
jgi:hypothetical protein